MLNPTRLRKVLGELVLSHGDDLALVIEDDGPTTGRALVNRHEVCHVVDLLSEPAWSPA
jgi:hypothetical protein